MIAGLIIILIMRQKEQKVLEKEMVKDLLRHKEGAGEGARIQLGPMLKVPVPKMGPN